MKNKYFSLRNLGKCFVNNRVLHVIFLLLEFYFGKHVKHSLAYPLTLMSHLQIPYADIWVLNDPIYDEIFFFPD